MIFAEGYTLLISSSCCSVTGLNHFFFLFPKASGLSSCFFSAGGKMSCVSGLYSMKPGGVKRLMGWSSTNSLPSLQHPPTLPQPFEGGVTLVALPFVLQHPPSVETAVTLPLGEDFLKV
jgi:hypothetical protein